MHPHPFHRPLRLIVQLLTTAILGFSGWFFVTLYWEQLRAPRGTPAEVWAWGLGAGALLAAFGLAGPLVDWWLWRREQRRAAALRSGS